MSSRSGVIFASLMTKSMLRYVFGLVALLITFSSCDPKVNLAGKYVEKPLIYGLINPDESVHLFRIQKAFLGEESAFVMAQNADSSYFKYTDLFVELVEYNEDGDETNRWALDTVLIGNKETGNPDDDEIDFFGPTQRLYSTAQDKILDHTGSSITDAIDASNEYEITLKKRPSHIAIEGMTIANMDTVTPIADARIEVVDASTFKLTNPNAQNADVIAPKMTLVNTTGDLTSYVVKFNAAANCAMYEVWLRFHYREVRDNVETLKSIEWRAKTIDSDPNSLGVIQVPITAQEIYSRIGTEIPVESGVIRKIGQADGTTEIPLLQNDGHTQDFDIFVRMGGDELFKYIDINDPDFTGVLQERPIYTNINNGLGVFSSRTQVNFLNRLYLSTESYDELVGGASTSGRGFVVDPD